MLLKHFPYNASFKLETDQSSVHSCHECRKVENHSFHSSDQHFPIRSTRVQPCFLTQGENVGHNHVRFCGVNFGTETDTTEVFAPAAISSHHAMNFFQTPINGNHKWVITVDSLLLLCGASALSTKAWWLIILCCYPLYHLHRLITIQCGLQMSSCHIKFQFWQVSTDHYVLSDMRHYHCPIWNITTWPN
jgi:hypothetical protein